MIRIAICDDDVYLTESIFRCLQETMEQIAETDFIISVFHSGEAFLSDVRSGVFFHIVFMDIQMKGITGTEVGAALRVMPNGDDVILIFMSHHDSYFEQMAYVGNFRFIKKPISITRLNDIFRRAYKIVFKSIENESKLFRYNINREIYSISAKEIAFLRSVYKFIEINIWNGGDETIRLLEKFYSTIEVSMSQLSNEHFIQCERSHIINLRYIQIMSGNTFVLKDKFATQIPIGRAYKDKARDAYSKFRGHHYE